MTLIVNVSKLKIFIDEKKSLSLDYKMAASVAGDMGDWMFQLGKEVAYKQVLNEIERLYSK
jgi:hypothetical protein